MMRYVWIAVAALACVGWGYAERKASFAEERAADAEAWARVVEEEAAMLVDEATRTNGETRPHDLAWFAEHPEDFYVSTDAYPVVNWEVTREEWEEVLRRCEQ